MSASSPRVLWRPTEHELSSSNLAHFARQVGFSPNRYDDLYQWSIHDFEAFWTAVWDYTGVIGQRGTSVLQRSGDERMFGVRWYPDARLNFAENLLSGPDERTALIEADERGTHTSITMGDLRIRVSRAQRALRALNVQPGDVVGAVLPNNADAVVALLACVSIGAIWTSCSPDFGAKGIIDRIGQVKPRILLAVDHYVYNGETHTLGEKLNEILRSIDEVEHLLLVGQSALPLEYVKAGSSSWDELCQSCAVGLIEFERFSFSHPLYVVFTSGTTGLPKGIVHTAGGVLLQHRKEHVLHCDVRPNDVMIWYTNTAWMMYHWLISGLASQATVVLYDGAPVPTTRATRNCGMLWELAEKTKVTHFGTSPPYLSMLADAEYLPIRHHQLTALRSLLAAGAPVSGALFEWVYQAVKEDLLFASISGGTEIMGCFVLGSPLHPVTRGEIACKALGMAVDVFDERGQSITGSKGELVCTQPFPSAPLTFWGENGDVRYRATYFSAYPGIWTHGDLALQTVDQTVIIYGRSDSTLKPRGIRIGTAEIYRIVDQQECVQDSIVFGYPKDGDDKIVLCLVMKHGYALDEVTKQHIAKVIRNAASPHHVPHYIFEVDDIPYTLNGKKVETAVKAMATGSLVKNIGSLRNPESLEQYRRLAGLDHPNA